MTDLADNQAVNPQHLPVAEPALHQQRLAEAARYAVLQRIAPVLQHDIAGFMQPIGMLTKILQRRVQMAEPDLPEITKNLASVSALVKEASTGCMNVIGWMISGEDKPVSLRSGVSEAIKLLGPELFGTELDLRNAISDEQTSVPQSFLRSVLMGALLAFCDHRSAGNILQVMLETGAKNTNAHHTLVLRMLPGDTVNTPVLGGTNRRSRSIDWQDVQAMADSFNVTMARGEGWLRLGLP